jgi:hypothetical protein
MHGRRRQKESPIMYRGSILHVSSWGRLALGLCLLVGLCLALGGQARPAHAQTTLTVTDCSNDSQLQADVAQANSDNASDTITFACSGDIPLMSTLNITGSMTLDGSGRSVTLDDGNSRRVLVVNGGVSLTLNALTVAKGSASGGGGLFNNGGTVSITNSTFANNSAEDGGGLDNEGGTVSITNSTFANNSAFAAGGLFNRGTVSITNSTFANNSASGLGGGLFNGGTVNISTSILAHNSGGNCIGGISDQGYNLSSDISCFTFTGIGSLQNTDPKLDPNGLQNNGGPTQTIALLSSSPAIDYIPAANCPATDQRSMTRPDDPSESKCDIGAYESNYDVDLGLTNVPANITTNATSPQGAVVTYTSPTATDESGDSSTASVTCTLASGSTFAIGTTTVTCTASDSDDTNSPVSGSFQVLVNGAATQTSALIATVNSFHLAMSLQTALDAKLNAALKAVNAGQTATACSDLSDFIGQVQAKIGKGITQSQANQLIAAAKQVQAVLGC